MLSQAYERRCALLARLCRGEAVPDADLQCAFQENPAVRAALLRINGLPRRFMGMGAPTPASWTREPLCAYSRDDREWLCVYEEDGPLMTLERAAADAQAAGNYTTLLLYDRPFPIGALRERILGLYDGLTAYCVVGLSQRLALDDARLPIPLSMMDLNALYLSLEQYRKTGDYGLFKRSIMQRIHRSHQHLIPLRLLEELSRYLILPIAKRDLRDISLARLERELEALFCDAANAEELVDGINRLFRDVPTDANGRARVDSAHFFEDVELYLVTHISESISLQGLSASFAISQTYMSRLFRKYSGKTFVEYLTDLRMDRAMQIIRETPELRVRDVAELVGYRDPFYFSRMFRKRFGKSPLNCLKRMDI